MNGEASANEVRLVDQRLAWRTVEREVLALDVETSEYLSINWSGAVLWDALAAGCSRTELVGLLAERGGIEHARAAQDVEAFLTQLRDRGLIAEGPNA